MHSISCIVQVFDAPSDTCSVELQGIGIIDCWLDGVAIAPTVDRSWIVGGIPGVVTMPDINRPCDATLIQVIPPGTTVSYDPDQIITYTGSIEIPTDASGSGCADIVFPTPYATVPTVSASAAHPASVTISNLTEAGFTACVTGGTVSSHHSVSYSSKSSNTSTATKNKALTVDHNEADVGTHYILDFKDGDVVWTVTDHASGPARNQVEATLSDSFKSTLGSGGGPPIIFSAETALPVDIPPWDGSTVQLPSWDTVLIDQGGWVAEGTTGPNIKVPTDGTYLLAYTCKFAIHTGDVHALAPPVVDLANNLIYAIAVNGAQLPDTGTSGSALLTGYDTGSPGSYPLPLVGDGVRIHPLVLHKDDDLQLWLANRGDTNTYRCYAAAIMLIKIGGSSNALATLKVQLHATNWAIPNGASAAIPWDEAEVPLPAMWSATTPTDVTIPADGTYQVSARLIPNEPPAGGMNYTVYAELDQVNLDSTLTELDFDRRNFFQDPDALGTSTATQNYPAAGPLTLSYVGHFTTGLKLQVKANYQGDLAGAAAPIFIGWNPGDAPPRSWLSITRLA